MFGRRQNSNQARICVLEFSANKVWLELIDWAASDRIVGSRFSRQLIPVTRQPEIHSYCDDWPPVVGRWSSLVMPNLFPFGNHLNQQHEFFFKQYVI